DRQQLLAEAAGDKTQHQIDQAVDHQQPHRGEMPEQRAAEPAAQRDARGETETEQRRGVIDLPSRHDHQHHREGVGPVHGPHPGRLDDFRLGRGGLLVADCKGRHGCFPFAVPYRFIRPEPGFRYCHDAIKSMHGGHKVHKKASRVAPARQSHAPSWDQSGARGDQDAGSSTVSTTWITPFDWLTFEIVTVEEPPLASMIMTLPSDFLTVSSSPSAVLSFLPSVRSDAASLPGTTW